MLSQFSGLEVDWNRGEVRFSGGRGAWGLVELRDDFWRDLQWWDDHFERRNCTSIRREARGEAAITGTDASDWGTGQLMWLDGAREEVVLQFSRVEQRRSINWRELLGIVRIFENFGHRLRGRCVLVETDNMAAKGAAANRSSTSGDMQELVRRLIEASELHGIQLRFTHTPGVKLIRPDQTDGARPRGVRATRARVAVESSGERGWSYGGRLCPTETQRGVVHRLLEVGGDGLDEAPLLSHSVPRGGRLVGAPRHHQLDEVVQGEDGREGAGRESRSERHS